jgi:hypothetical protein
MKMFAPKGAVVRADAIVVIEDASFVVGTRHRKAWSV